MGAPLLVLALALVGPTRAHADPPVVLAPESSAMLDALARDPRPPVAEREAADADEPTSDPDAREPAPSGVRARDHGNRPARVFASPGRGVSFDAGSAYSLTLRPRLALRNTLLVQPDQKNVTDVRSFRLFVLGHVLHRDLTYGIQLGFGEEDPEDGTESPLLDAYVDLDRVPGLRIRVGQFFVPFDRLRSTRQSSLQTTDRGTVVRELALERDVGIELRSDDLGQTGGHFAYRVGLFGGEGRNRFDATDVGFLYAARIEIRPFGGFDADVQGDLGRANAPRLALGTAIAYAQNAERLGSTHGAALLLGGFDQIHVAADLTFKWRGLFLVTEFLLRGSSDGTRRGVTSSGQPWVEVPSRGLGYVVQASYAPHPRVELILRWDELRSRFATDAVLRDTVDHRGRGLCGGTSLYFLGHALKLQADVTHRFGSSLQEGATAVRLQLDATF